MINIKIIDRFTAFIEPHIILIAAQQTLLHQNITDEVDFSILVDDEDKLKELNYQYLGIDSATDVLSFPANEIDPETGRNYLGDIIISFTHAEKQARNANHSTESEIQLLVVHGILHLLGYDHANNKEKKEMWAIQDDILTSISDINNTIS
jgi:probable rRNA maturation factor